MGLILLVIIVIVVLAFATGESSKELEIKKKDLERRSGIKVLQTFKVNYLGGLKNVPSYNNATLEICDNRLKIITSVTNHILIDYIGNVGIQSESQIRERISLNKLVFFGVLAFGMKGKESTVTKNYISIEVKDSRDEFIVILESQGNETDIVNLINRTISEYKQEKLD